MRSCSSSFFSFRACRHLLLLGAHGCFLTNFVGRTYCFQGATAACPCVGAKVLTRFCTTEATAVNMCMESICTRCTNYLVGILQTKKNDICEQRLGTSRLALWHSACERTASFHYLPIYTVNNLRCHACCCVHPEMAYDPRSMYACSSSRSCLRIRAEPLCGAQ